MAGMAWILETWIHYKIEKQKMTKRRSVIQRESGVCVCVCLRDRKRKREWEI